MHDEPIREALRDAGRELARVKGVPENTRLSDLIVDSLDRMSMIVAVENALDTSIDDDRIMTLNFNDEDALIRELQEMVAARDNKIPRS